MNNWFTSDLHYGHSNIIKYCNRPFKNKEEMNEMLIANWNAVVNENDDIYSLGDFAFGKIGYIKSILTRLKGNIHMITGNHDEEILNHKDALINEGLVLEIVPYKEILVNGQFICLFHYGARVWNRSHKGSWLLYGHSHNSLPPYGKSVDVGVDSTSILKGRTEYRPYSFAEVAKFMDTRSIEVADQHGIRETK